jgi:hypothetical protein
LADKTVATQLFNEGRILLDQGRIAEACAKLEESQRIEPGGGTLLNVALCHERQGRTAAAWVEFTEAMGLARRDENALRVDFARSHLALLAPLLSRLAIQVPPGSDIPDLEVKCDGSILARAAWGSPVPVDPVEHLVEAVAPGRLPWKQSILVGPNADSKTAVVPVLENAPVRVESLSPSPAASSPGGPVRELPSTAGTGSSRLGAASDQADGRSEGSAAPAWIALTLGLAAGGGGDVLRNSGALREERRGPILSEQPVLAARRKPKQPGDSICQLRDRWNRSWSCGGRFGHGAFFDPLGGRSTGAGCEDHGPKRCTAGADRRRRSLGVARGRRAADHGSLVSSARRASGPGGKRRSVPGAIAYTSRRGGHRSAMSP